jgi:hypothetical protein
VDLLLLEPGAGLPEAELALVAGLEQLGGLVGDGRHVVADGKRQGHEQQAQAEQRAQRLPRPQAAGAQNGVLGALRQPGQHATEPISTEIGSNS